ncbi:kinase [Exiguobacterium sp. RIT452]|uniref:Kinase n=1 Tax=Exiguobacterium undae TaxID=169177 RepID=A0ABX2V8Q2_9BACL|nr:MULTISPECIES: sporulation phosphorelay system protein KapB [Exiguobacterium]OAN14576.1 kinase [Exiguobacterium undae]RJO98328.1 kinase [Exiguobacterium sp. RIT452]
MSNVRFTYKTGKYFGRLFAERPQGLVVEVLAVEKHPIQGDLHNPNQVDVPLFHVRPALHPHEKVTVAPSVVYAYDGEIPPYADSLRRAYEKDVERLNGQNPEADAFVQKCLENYKELESIYAKRWG